MLGHHEDAEFLSGRDWGIGGARSGGYRNGCTIPFRENLQEISKDLQDGLQA